MAAGIARSMDRIKVPALLRLLADAIERGDADGDLDIESEPTIERDHSREPYDMTHRWNVIDAGETWKMRIRTKNGVARAALMDLK